MAPRKPAAPKKKNKNIKNASAMDIVTTVAPHLQDIINYGAHGTAALGAGALGYVPYKLKKIGKKSVTKKNRGGVVRGFSPIARPQRFKGVF